MVKGMDTSEKRVAKEIIDKIGSVENIKTVEHCATRLRLILNDKEKYDGKGIEEIEGVKGQFYASGQHQIILGTGFVDKVYGEVILLTGKTDEKKDKSNAYSDLTTSQKISRTLGDVFVPIIPVLVATGLFMGLRGLILNLGISMNDEFLMFSQILTDTAFAFLPALVAWSAIKKFGGNPVIGLVIGLMLVSPSLPNAYSVASGAADPIFLSLAGLSIPIVDYQGSVLAALVLAIIAAKIEKGLKKVVPDVLDLIVTPFLTLLISMILGLIVVGPVMHTVEQAVFGAVKGFIALPFGIGGLLIGGLVQVLVVTGLHHALSALEVELLATTGVNAYNAIITCAIVAQGAASIAVALKTKNTKKRSLYLSSAIPAFLGITEPAIFGINLRFIKPFVFGCIGGAVGGMLSAAMKLAGTGMGVTAIPGTLLYMNHLPAYLLVNLISIAVAFVLTFLFFKPEE